MTTPSIAIELSAVIVTVEGDAPFVLTITDPHSGLRALPSGPLDPRAHPTLERGLRGWVTELTGLPLGYVEQLYTFGDRGRDPTSENPDRRQISITYLALTRMASLKGLANAAWTDWYEFFPWEDRRRGVPPPSVGDMLAELEHWADAAGGPAIAEQRRQRLAIAFGAGRLPFDPERTLDRYELLYEAGAVAEARRVGCASTDATGHGRPMARDHRRVLATSISRLRGKLSYRPVVFELLPASFTLLQLQRTVETLAGIRLHKQNFRRLVERGGLVEPTGARETRTGGRPAEHYRFRTKVLSERPAPGVGLPERKT